MIHRGKAGWVGFDVGATSVKAAQVVRRQGRYFLRAAAAAPRREKWRNLSPAFAASASADEICCAASLCASLEGSAAAALMPMALCEAASVDVPAARRGEHSSLAAAMEAETQRSMQDCVLDSWPAALQSGKVNAIAAPRIWSDQISADLADSGWDCRVIDALPWAIARAVAMAAPDAGARSIAALDWGYTDATMYLIHQGQPAMVRSLKECGFGRVLSTVAAALRLHEQDAERMLLRFGLRGESPSSTTAGAEHGALSRSSGIIEGLLTQEIARLVHEMQRTLTYWRGATRGQSLEAVYLFGGGGTVAGVEEQLRSMLGLTVEPWRLPAERDEEGEKFPPGCLIGAAAGLSALAWEAA